MVETLLNSLEDFADKIYPYHEWYRNVGIISMLEFLVFLAAEIKPVGFICLFIAIWCGGLWLTTALFSRSQTSWTEEGVFPTSEVRNGTEFQKIYFTAFYLFWWFGLIGITIAFLFKIAS